MTRYYKHVRTRAAIAAAAGTSALLGVAVWLAPAEAARPAEPGGQPSGLILAQFEESGPIRAKLVGIVYQPGGLALVDVLIENVSSEPLEDVSGTVVYLGGAGAYSYCCLVPEAGKLDPFDTAELQFEIDNVPEGPISFTVNFEAVPVPPATDEPTVTATETEEPTLTAEPTSTVTATLGARRIESGSSANAVRPGQMSPHQVTPTATPGGPVPAGQSEFSGPLVVHDWHIADVGHGSILTVHAVNVSNIWLGGVQGELRLRGQGGTEVSCCLPALPSLVGPGETTSVMSTFDRRVNSVMPSFMAQFFADVTEAPTATPTLTPTFTATPVITTTSTITITATATVSPTPSQTPFFHTLVAAEGSTGALPARSHVPHQGLSTPMGEAEGPVLMALSSWQVSFSDENTRVEAAVEGRSEAILKDLNAELRMRAGSEVASDCCYAPDPPDLAFGETTVFTVDLAPMPFGAPLTFNLIVSGAPDIATSTPTPTRTPVVTPTVSPTTTETPGPGTEETPVATHTMTPDGSITPGTATATSETPTSETPTPTSTSDLSLTPTGTPTSHLSTPPGPVPGRIYLPRAYQR